MTRIFEALRKSRTTSEPVPFSAAGGPLQPVPVGRGSAAARSEPLAPGVDVVIAPALPDDVAREMAALRIGLESALEDRPSRVVMFMSSINREGTTTVAAQFASMLATDKRLRVLALDLNARRPALASRFAARNRPDASRDEPRIALGRIGSEAPGAGLSPTAARAFITSVSGEYDWVVLDGPPVLDAPEAADYASLADGIVMVLRSGHTKRPVVSRAVDLLRKSGARVLGTVLNRRRLEIPDFLYRRI